MDNNKKEPFKIMKSKTEKNFSVFRDSIHTCPEVKKIRNLNARNGCGLRLRIRKKKPEKVNTESEMQYRQLRLKVVRAVSLRYNFLVLFPFVLVFFHSIFFCLVNFHIPVVESGHRSNT